MTVKLPRLPAAYNGEQLARWWNLAMSEIEAQFGAVAAAITAQQAANAAQAAANAAQAAATTAQGAANAIAYADALRDSYATGLTISASDAGSDVTVTISAHTRIYGDGTSVSVSGGTVTGLPYSTPVWLYYDQASRAGGTVTYQSSTQIQGNGVGNPDRHFVGAVTTPAALGSPVDGVIVVPPGGVIP